MLRDEIAQYTKLTGEDGNHTPIMKIGAYLDGYDEGLRALDKVRAEIEQYQSDAFYPDDVMINKKVILGIIDKYKESEE